MRVWDIVQTAVVGVDGGCGDAGEGYHESINNVWRHGIAAASLLTMR